jgi:tripartite motif-containing protein 2/3
VTEIDPTTGDTIASFSHNAFQEPVDIAVMPKSGKILVADNSASCVFVFDSQGRPLLQVISLICNVFKCCNSIVLSQVGKKGSQRGQFNLISSVAASPNDDILVADSRIQIFSSDGDFKREIFSEGKGKKYFSSKKVILFLNYP